MFVPVIYKMEVSRKVDAGVRSIESAEGESLDKEKKPEVKVNRWDLQSSRAEPGKVPLTSRKVPHFACNVGTRSAATITYFTTGACNAEPTLLFAFPILAPSSSAVVDGSSTTA